MKKYLIKSVLGFNLNADITDKDGNIINKGIKNTIIPKCNRVVIKSRILDRKFFTNFNDDLLNQIREYRRLND